MKWHRPFRVLFVVIAVGCSAVLGMEKDSKPLLGEKQKPVSNLKNKLILSFLSTQKLSDQPDVFAFSLSDEERLSIIEDYVQAGESELVNTLLLEIEASRIHKLYKKAVEQKSLSTRILMSCLVKDNKLSGISISFTELESMALQAVDNHDIESFKYLVTKIVDKDSGSTFYKTIQKGLNKDESGAYEALAEIQMTAEWALYSKNTEKVCQALFRYVIYSAEESNKIPEESLPVNSKDLKALSLPKQEKFFIRAVRRNNLNAHTSSFAKAAFYKQPTDAGEFYTPIEEV